MIFNNSTAFAVKYTEDIDQQLHQFYFNADKYFEVVPSETSNFKVFCLCNPELTSTQHHTIWEYYRSLFVHAKLRGCELSRFRLNLGSFIAGGDSRRSELLTFGESISRTENITKSIGLSLWLPLQYKTDLIIGDLNKDISVEQMTSNTGHLANNTIADPGHRVSYFYKGDYQEPLVQDVTDRKLTLKTIFSYRHKTNTVFICDTKFGAARVAIGPSPMNHWIDRNLSSGLEIVVRQARVRTNIDDTMPYLNIDQWYVE